MRQLIQLFTTGLLLLAIVAPAAAQQSGGPTDAERLQAYIEQTGQILERSRDFVSDAPNPRSVRILEQAFAMHRRSIELAQDGQPKMAFAYSMKARDGGQQAARIARDLSGSSERLQRRLERYMELRERVGDRVHESGDERALRFLQESEQQARRARDLQKQGDIALALQVLEGAENLLGKAARIAFEGAGAGRLEREMERTRAFLERVSSEIGDDPAGQDLLESARMALRRAEEAASRGQLMRALNSLQLARRLGARASASDDRLDPATVERQIQRFDERYERVRERVADSGSDQARQTMERARVHRDRAEEFLAGDKAEQAMRHIKAGLDLLAEANELAR
jgi:hypothetical protein